MAVEFTGEEEGGCVKGAARWAKSSKRMCQAADRCHICLLPIDANIVSSRHPLFGTIDHVIPLARGGQDAKCNRAPAHLMCNAAKGSRELTQRKHLNLQMRVVKMAGLRGRSFQKWRTALIPPKPPGTNSKKWAPALAVWENEGELYT